MPELPNGGYWRPVPVADSTDLQAVEIKQDFSSAFVDPGDLNL
jgi:hypothetical protein